MVFSMAVFRDFKYHPSTLAKIRKRRLDLHVEHSSQLSSEMKLLFVKYPINLICKLHPKISSIDLLLDLGLYLLQFLHCFTYFL